MTTIHEYNQSMIKRFDDTWRHDEDNSPYSYYTQNDKDPVHGEPDRNDIYANVVFGIVASSVGDIGGIGNTAFIKRGTMSIDLYFPVDEGLQRATDMMQKVNNAYEGQRITRGISIISVIPNYVGPTENEDYFYCNVAIEYNMVFVK